MFQDQDIQKQELTPKNTNSETDDKDSNHNFAQQQLQ